jgi:hypothetical protein
VARPPFVRTGDRTIRGRMLFVSTGSHHLALVRGVGVLGLGGGERRVEGNEGGRG